MEMSYGGRELLNSPQLYRDPSASCLGLDRNSASGGLQSLINYDYSSEALGVTERLFNTLAKSLKTRMVSQRISAASADPSALAQLVPHRCYTLSRFSLGLLSFNLGLRALQRGLTFAQ